MPTVENVAQQTRQFILENFLYGQTRQLKDDESFLDEGIVDSTGVLQLVSFLEESYGITVEDEELTPDNLDSVNRVAAFISRKLNAVAGSAAPQHESLSGERS